MGSPIPGPRGGATGVREQTFPTTFTQNQAKSKIQERLRASAHADGTEYTAARCVGMCEGFAVYAVGTGSWNVQVSPDPDSGMWVDLNSTDKTGDGFLTGQFHHWIRGRVAGGSTLELWLFKKYATY